MRDGRWRQNDKNPFSISIKSAKAIFLRLTLSKKLDLNETFLSLNLWKRYPVTKAL